MKAETFSSAHGCTWRLEYSGPERGIFWRQLANFHAHISATYTDEDGAIVYRIEGQAAGTGGRAFSFEIPARRFNCHRSFMRELYSVSGAGSCVWVGCAAALRRAILEASDSPKGAIFCDILRYCFARPRTDVTNHKRDLTALNHERHDLQASAAKPRRVLQAA